MATTSRAATPSWPTTLERALAEKRLVLHHQPKFDLFRQRITGVEALVRWPRPGLGDVAPATFIPVSVLPLVTVAGRRFSPAMKCFVDLGRRYDWGHGMGAV
ncbi:MAG: EAL domain-containing protein [Magnetospirillum sp.]|nr:EAL domain-containing protein [Magnetospirillum sp.]